MKRFYTRKNIQTSINYKVIKVSLQMEFSSFSFQFAVKQINVFIAKKNLSFFRSVWKRAEWKKLVKYSPSCEKNWIYT